jgi:transposase
VLESWLRSKTIPQALGMRARVVLLSGEGSSLRAVAQWLRLTERTICLWRRRFQQEGVSGLRSRRRRGRPRVVTRAKEFAVVTATSRLPPAATHWSARRLVAKEMGESAFTPLARGIKLGSRLVSAWLLNFLRITLAPIYYRGVASHSSWRKLPPVGDCSP